MGEQLSSGKFNYDAISSVISGIDFGFKIIGVQDLTSSAMNAIYISSISGALDLKFERTAYDVLSSNRITLKSSVSSDEYKKFVMLFNLTKSAKIQLYNEMRKAATEPGERKYLDSQIELLKRICVESDYEQAKKSSCIFYLVDDSLKTSSAGGGGGSGHGF